MKREFLRGILFFVLPAVILVNFYFEREKLSKQNLRLIKEQTQLQEDYNLLAKELLEKKTEVSELQAQVDVVNTASVYKIETPSPKPLWPMPGLSRSEVHHLVLEVFPLEGNSLPYQIHVLKNVESGINEVGILSNPNGFYQGAILETKVGKIRVLDAEEADAVLRKFGRKK